ncbi:neurofilament heavy polypeptide isoform X2 [Notolabrus celidotus]|uniref:neurofilament heavy polypeptide isoform X2 n=1 Tax=Notolabrus celidotus TaxID=1203425 RepID=UPI00148F9AF8|nr:neurofilament heavy polypeptide isoform X2 [Notolabrus celidotus]
METKYPTLKRPKRKLCYLTNTESQPKKWMGPLTLGDIDKMFDDLDSPSTNEVDLAPPTPQLQISDHQKNQSEKKVSSVPQEGHIQEKPPGSHRGPEGDALNSSRRSARPEPDMDLDIPFKVHGPIKTSSPIEVNIALGRGREEPDKEKDRVVSPILFDCNDVEEEEEAKIEPAPRQKTQSQNDDFELESPPVKLALNKPNMSCRKKEMQGVCKESQPVQKQTPKKPAKVVPEGKRKTDGQKNKEPPVPAVRQEPEPEAPRQTSESVNKEPEVEVSTRVGKDMTAFLQRLREAGQAKPPCSRKSLSPVKVSTPPPEPKDDFLILEDETPLWISIPTKNATSRKQKQSRTSSADKDSSTDKGAKERAAETGQKQLEAEPLNKKLGTSSQKVKKTKGKGKKNEEPELRNDTPDMSCPEDSPAVDLVEQEILTKKKQRLKKVPLKERDEAQRPEDTTSRDREDSKPAFETKQNSQKSPDIKKVKPLKEGKENVRRGRAKTLKESRKVVRGSDAGKKAVFAEAVKEPRQEGGDLEDWGFPSDGEVVDSEAQTATAPLDGNDEQNNLPLVSERSSAENDQAPGKRRRKQTRQWWLTSPEQTQATDRQPVKTAKQIKGINAAAPPPVTAKKDKVLKRKGKREPVSSSDHVAKKAKGNKAKQSNNRNRTKNTPVKIKATEEEVEAEREEKWGQEDEVPDEDGGDQSNPMDLTHRDRSLRTGDQVFQKVYTSTEKHPPVLPSPRGPGKQLRAAESEKRRRKPPGNWWAAAGPTEEVENISPQPPQQEPKLQKERKKKTKQNRSKLGTPKNGNVAVSSKPQGGASVSPLNAKPSAPKSIRRCLATFKDIFTSNTESLTVTSSGGAGQRNTLKVDAGDGSVPDESVRGVLSMEAVESNSPPSLQSPQDSKCQSENTLKSHRSGPSSMIELQEYEEDNESVQAALSASDLCAPPLKPLVLQPKDKANLTEWFKNLWSASVDSSPEITPDQFDWYFHKGRAIGFLVDLNCGSICNGKILLGSFMKKPLMVDHSATSVFNLLTSSVSVTINGKESRFNPGQSFMVPCGHAYSIKNVSAQPSVLCFTRILAESLD